VIALNLPSFEYQLKNSENKTFIFDVIRKKYIQLTPEEWVRQHFVHLLINQKAYPKSLISIEKQLTINKLKKRTDIVVYNNLGLPHLIVECKAPSIKINQTVFDQIARYNLNLQARYLVLTNGLQHFFAEFDLQKQGVTFIDDIPKY